MVVTKMWARRMVVILGVVAFGAAASTGAYQAAGVATSLGSFAFAR